MEETDYMGDDLYPRDGAFFQPAQPEDQVKEEQIERAKAKSAIPMLKEIVSRFDTKIAFYDSLDSIDVGIDTDPATFQKIHAANRLTRDNLKAEKHYLESLIDQYK